jgi:hypothetical protein
VGAGEIAGLARAASLILTQVGGGGGRGRCSPNQPTKRLPKRKVTSSHESPVPARAGAGQRRRDTRGTVGDQQGQEGASRRQHSDLSDRSAGDLPISAGGARRQSTLATTPPCGTHRLPRTGWHTGGPWLGRVAPSSINAMQACCVDAFAAEQGVRDAGLSIVLDMYSPIAEVPSPNQAHDLISSDAQKCSVRWGMPRQHHHR